ncbi:MAG: flagellar basal body-associated FliL family protein [Synergistales bacterium]|nr:flagellar basal body-associated FliL family protein [Synergistales bacterium]
MKRLLIFAVVGLLALILGVGGGIFMGMKFFGQPNDVGGQGGQAPGPTVPLGEFTVNLADKEPHVARLTIVLEVTSPEAVELVSAEGWKSRLRHETILTVKNKRLNDMRSGEGVLELGHEIKHRLNALLPLVKQKPPVSRVLFENFILQ